MSAATKHIRYLEASPQYKNFARALEASEEFLQAADGATLDQIAANSTLFAGVLARIIPNPAAIGATAKKLMAGSGYSVEEIVIKPDATKEFFERLKWAVPAVKPHMA